MTSKAFLQSVLIAFMATMLFACSSSDDGSGNTTEVTATTPAPIVTVQGENSITVNQGETYTDLGATAIDSVGETVEVTVSGEVDTSKAGTYTLTYTAVDSDGNTTTTTRTINVLDKKPPVITLVGEATVTVEQNATYVEPGATAKDNETDVEVVITGSVNTSIVGMYTVTYIATDSEENTAQLTRTINVVDTTPPVITLIGDNPVTVVQNTAYSESGAIAKDGDIDIDVVITGVVNASVAGVYAVTYTAVDSAGNSSNTSRTVNVLDKTPPVITLKGDSSVDITYNSIYSESGATATDGGINVEVIITGAVDTSIVGVYTITYTSTDSAGNSSSISRVVNVKEQDPNLTIVNIDKADLNISDDEFEDYSLIGTDQLADATSGEIALKKDERGVVALVDKVGQPILMGRKFAGEGDVELSISSSAEMFILTTPRFTGVETNDTKELSRRIQAHPSFPLLKEKILSAILNDNPCPLNPTCNYLAAEVSVVIANSLEIDDLYEGVE